MAKEGRSAAPTLKDGHILTLVSLPGEDDWKIDTFQTRSVPSPLAHQADGALLSDILRERETKRFASPEEAAEFVENKIARRRRAS